MGSSPGVTLMCDFVQSAKAGSSFGGFLDYMNRPEAFEISPTADGQKEGSLFAGYMDYMRNDDKSDGLFTSTIDHAPAAMVESIKQNFNERQNRGCPLYRGIISFDNEFLKELGLLDPAGVGLDQTIIKETARASIQELIEKSHLDPARSIWTGAIHTNTDNVHVHYAIIEDQKSSRKKDMLELKAIDASKSVIVNKLVGSEETILRTRLLRENLLPGLREAAKNNTYLLMKLLDDLPDNIPWEYGSSKFEPYRNRINQTTNEIIMSTPGLSETWEKVNQSLDKYANDVRRFYGDGDRHLWEGVKGNRLSDFYRRAGNSVLKELQREVPVSLHGSFLPGIDARSELYSSIMDVAARTSKVDIVPLFESGLTDQQTRDVLRLLGSSQGDIATHMIYPGCEDKKIIHRLIEKLKINPNTSGLSDLNIQKAFAKSLADETRSNRSQRDPEEKKHPVNIPRHASCREVHSNMKKEQLPHHGRQLYISCASAMRRLTKEYERHIKDLEKEYEQSQISIRELS